MNPFAQKCVDYLISGVVYQSSMELDDDDDDVGADSTQWPTFQTTSGWRSK
jgi:hypothetical protein